jgi:hypothetical protein
MSNSVQGQVDDLIEELFLTHRSSCSLEFLRMKFRNGATNVTMLSSFEDAPEPNFDWTTAPGMDNNNVYHPPVLAKVNLQRVDESDDSSCSSISTSTTKDEDPANDDVDNLAPKEKDEKKPVKMTCS